jgi:NADH-quinone oxidoreductase subunit F
MLSKQARDDIEALRSRYPVARSALIPSLLRAQNEIGWVPPDAMAEVAALLGISVEAVAEVASFYSLIFTEPVGKHVIQLCTNVSCMLAGSDDVRDHLERRLGIRPGQTTADGRFTLRIAECLAACEEAPCMIVDEDRYPGLTPARVDEILEGVGGWSISDIRHPISDMPMSERVLLRHVGVPDQGDIATYVRNGGYEALRRALRDYTPEQIVQLVERSQLRGRGGAGFPTGRKWQFVPADAPVKYLVVNADEGEPGTFKDRTLIEGDPHLLVEGMILTCYAAGIRHAFIYLRREFYLGAKKLRRAIDQAYEEGFLGENILGSGFACDIVLHPGAGAYIAGEETALLESLEGQRAMPRLKPPYFPAVMGLYNEPTVLNNVETLCCVPWIVREGPEWWLRQGPPQLYSVSGHVNRPGVIEAPLGITLRELIERAGGMRNGHRFKACYPGGSSSKPLVAEHLDVPLDHESLAKVGSMLGSAAVIVMDETTDMVRVIARVCEFYRDESCGKCTPCREGTVWVTQVFERILHGHGRVEDLELLRSLSKNMTGTCLCPLGESVPPSLNAGLEYFRDEFEAYIRRAGEPVQMPVRIKESVPAPGG